MKVKTRESAQKRIRVTKSGKMIRGHAYSSHLKEKKSSSRRRRQKEPTLVSSSDVKKLKRLLPYGSS